MSQRKMTSTQNLTDMPFDIVSTVVERIFTDNVTETSGEADKARNLKMVSKSMKRTIDRMNVRRWDRNDRSRVLRMVKRSLSDPCQSEKIFEENKNKFPFSRYTGFHEMIMSVFLDNRIDIDDTVNIAWYLYESGNLTAKYASKILTKRTSDRQSIMWNVFDPIIFSYMIDLICQKKINILIDDYNMGLERLEAKQMTFCENSPDNLQFLFSKWRPFYIGVIKKMIQEKYTTMVENNEDLSTLEAYQVSSRRYMKMIKSGKCDDSFDFFVRKREMEKRDIHVPVSFYNGTRREISIIVPYDTDYRFPTF